MKKWVIGIGTILSMQLIVSCNKKEDAPQYQCDLNSSNYLNITANDNNNKFSGNDIAGGFLRNEGVDRSYSIYDVGFYKDKVYNTLNVKFDTLVTPGNYTLADIASAEIMYDAADQKTNFIELNFNISHLDETYVETFNNNVFYYSYASGSFEGKYLHPITADTVTITGTFCSDPIPE